jgi:hypothetical protein
MTAIFSVRRRRRSALANYQENVKEKSLFVAHSEEYCTQSEAGFSYTRIQAQESNIGRVVNISWRSSRPDRRKG